MIDTSFLWYRRLTLKGVRCRAFAHFLSHSDHLCTARLPLVRIKMSRYILIAVLFLSLCSITKQEDYRRPTKIVTSCCKSVSSAVVNLDILSYEHQPALGPCVEAIVFQTNKGKVCSNPKARWVSKKIKEMQKPA
ncbi:eotaxin-like isoform X1 [Scleropages formosus]|uniref:Eotaxin-like n=1 Tax=Scleropages formosus TaxID=113540 RepID=A0A8C9RI03_SCLFO|nr:eotaxin-like isoform X1 [Scleropages formosus]